MSSRRDRLRQHRAEEEVERDAASAQPPEQGEADAASHGPGAPQAEGTPPQEAAEEGDPTPAAQVEDSPAPAVEQPTPSDEELAAARGLPSLEEYVAREVAITRIAMQAGTLKEVIDPRDGSDRADRTARYARWRYQAFLNGEVASL